MFASERQVYGMFILSDQREASQMAAERFAQLKAAGQVRREKRLAARREARSRRAAVARPA